MRCIALFTTLFLFSVVPGQTPSDPNRDQRRDQHAGEEILTADNFKESRRIDGAETEEETFLLQVNAKLPPYKFRLIPDAAVKDNLGSNNPPHQVGRIEIFTTTPSALIQTIEVTTHAGVGVFRQYFNVLDVNLDGFLDIAVVDEFGAKWGRQKYWLFDRRSGRYVTNALTDELHRITHNGIEPHPETKELEVTHFPEVTPRPGRVNEIYKIVNGHLVLTKAEEVRSTSQGLRVFIRERVNGKMRTVETRDIHQGAAGANSG